MKRKYFDWDIFAATSYERDYTELRHLIGNIDLKVSFEAFEWSLGLN